MKIKGSFWARIIVPAVLLLLLYFAIDYLASVYQERGLSKFIYSLVLVAALIIGVSHIILYLSRKLVEKRNTTADKKTKRRLENYRNIINYATPFVLVAMLYHFWQKEWVLGAIIVSLLLLDRLNELLRKNK